MTQEDLAYIDRMAQESVDEILAGLRNGGGSLWFEIVKNKMREVAEKINDRPARQILELQKALDRCPHRGCASNSCLRCAWEQIKAGADGKN